MTCLTDVQKTKNNNDMKNIPKEEQHYRQRESTSSKPEM